MVYFNTRKKLENEYYAWLEKNPELKNCPFNVITFLQLKKYLNEEKILEDINKVEEE